MKVLSFNTGYFLDYDGTYRDYIKRPWKSVLGTEKEMENLQKFLQFVEKEDPDFVLVQEVDGGSIRTSTNGQQHYLSQRMSERFNCNFHNKYRGKIYPKLPVLRQMGNAVFYKKGDVINHELDNGRKNLVQEIKTQEFSLFSLHLATFGGWIRKNQLEQIRELAEKRNSYLIAGDLNFHKGRKEIEDLEENLGNPVHSPGKTFPANNPKKKLDLVTASENIKISNLKQHGNRFSDHRPFTFEIEKN